MHVDSDISRLLTSWTDGDAGARDQLMPLVFDELRTIAKRQYQNERDDHTLQPTAIVNELYMRLAAQKKVQWRHRREFFSVAARLVRRILVDHARKRAASKRGDGEPRVVFDEALGLPAMEDPMLVALDECLNELSQLDERGARIVELHAFTGLTFEEISELLNISRATVMRDWKHARLWLRRALLDEPAA
ncbi:MAG: ECF-type sigma factor [Acidobacteriota bacterium]